MESTITAEQLERVAADLDPLARETAHGLAWDDPQAFACEYIRALAAVLGRAGAEQCAPGETWEPADWLEGDERFLRDTARRLEITGLDLRRTGDLWAAYEGA